ncbi:DUF1642 domain-containing protein [Streptococcus uberis]|uniref:DUF1642 domain-containing protein n=1 Tax=Streptococcus uberis TaxID=1349 RepID=UPI001FF5E702|nr:DUF1642 domain-containing protein [Streptococcus uberis]MCK1222632.1 DUF1642 domain-containing protein [Streptococcus uberis]
MKIENKKAYIPCEIVETQINNGLDIRVRIDKTHDLYINRKLLTPDIDQPKPEIPQMIFDVIESFDEDAEYLHEHLNHQSDEVREWLTHNERDFYEAWLAYPNITVKKEKLYTVELPNPNRNSKGCAKFRLEKLGDKVYLVKRKSKDVYQNKDSQKLTEQEIRKDFDWAWQFAKEVEY